MAARIRPVVNVRPDGTRVTMVKGPLTQPLLEGWLAADIKRVLNLR
jgi:hypothetical protein